MSRLQTMEKVVLEILENQPAARVDDYVLMYYVCAKTCPTALQGMSLGNALLNHIDLNIPNWKSVERARRKVQEKRPDLVSPAKAKKRREEEERYREYAHT